MNAAKRESIQLDHLYPKSAPSTVWKALTEPELLARWWAPGDVRPVVGHNYHFHIRISCPGDSSECKAQPVTPTDEGCGKDLDAWFKKKTEEPKPTVARKPILMAALPPACKQILMAP